LRFAQFDQGIIPSLFPHVGNPQIDMGRGGAGIKSNDSTKVLFGDRQLAILHGLHALAEDGGGLERGVLRGQAKEQREAQESFA
jgi:hypothetical protein